MPTMPRNAPKLSCKHKDVRNVFVKRRLRVEDERGVEDLRWCRGNIQRRARCPCGWRRSGRWSGPPETEPAEPPSPRGPISCDAGTELGMGERTAVNWEHPAFPSQGQWVRARDTPWTPVHHTQSSPGTRKTSKLKFMDWWPVLGLFLLISLHSTW